MKKLFRKYGASFTRSWIWLADGFSDAYRWICASETNSPGEVIWRTRHKHVEKTRLPPELGGFAVIKKFYDEKRFWRYFFRPSLALREAYGFMLAKEAGIPTAQVLGFGETRRGIRLKTAFFMTRFAENTLSGLEFYGDGTLKSDRATLMKFVSVNMEFLGRLHAAGLTHGGAHPRNFLWRTLPDGELETVWIDLATVRKLNFFSRDSRIRLDLCDFLEKYNLSESELKTAMGHYAKFNSFPGMDAFRP